MDRENVLMRARNKKKNHLDEMEMDILLRGNHVGLITGLVVCLGIMVAKMYLDQPYQDVHAVLCAVICGESTYKGIRLKDKTLAVVGVLWGLLAIFLLIGYFL